MDARQLIAVRASRAWYDDVFSLHRIRTRVDGGLWRVIATWVEHHDADGSSCPTSSSDRPSHSSPATIRPAG